MLWLWHRLAATAPIQLLAWELPYADGVALKDKKKKTKKKKVIAVLKKKKLLPIAIYLFILIKKYPGIPVKSFFSSLVFMLHHREENIVDFSLK